MDLVTEFTSQLTARVLRTLIESAIEQAIGVKPSIPSAESVKALEAEERIEPNKIVGDFATRNKEFSERVFELRKLVETYCYKDAPHRPLNVLVAAPPGSGKSFLVKQILRSLSEEENGLDFSFHEFYVSSFTDSDSVIYSIHNSVLKKDGNKIPVIFFDEIDSRVEGENIYSHLLSPMWDGKYLFNQEERKIGRCILFFAGSSISAEAESQAILDSAARFFDINNPLSYNAYYQNWFEDFVVYVNLDENKKKKLSDFTDRIDSIVRIPPVHPSLLGSDAVEELKDIAAIIIKNNHSSVSFVEKKAIFSIVYRLMGSNSRRSAEKMIFCARLKDANRLLFTDFTERDQMVSLKDLASHEADSTKPALSGFYKI